MSLANGKLDNSTYIWLPFNEGSGPVAHDHGTSDSDFTVVDSGNAWSAKSGWFQGNDPSANYAYSSNSTVISIADYLNGVTASPQGQGGSCLAVFVEWENDVGIFFQLGSQNTPGEGYYTIKANNDLRHNVVNGSTSTAGFLSHGNAMSLVGGATETYLFVMDAQNRIVTSHRTDETANQGVFDSLLPIDPTSAERANYLDSLEDVNLTANGLPFVVGTGNSKTVAGAPTSIFPHQGAFRRFLMVDLSSLDDPYQFMLPAAREFANWQALGKAQDELPDIMTEHW